jgi:hypothetical protein
VAPIGSEIAGTVSIGELERWRAANLIARQRLPNPLKK